MIWTVYIHKQQSYSIFPDVCGTGIVYVFSQKDAESVSSELQKSDIVAYPYHANMNPDDKSRVHRKWTSNKIQVSGWHTCWYFYGGGSTSNLAKICFVLRFMLTVLFFILSSQWMESLCSQSVTPCLVKIWLFDIWFTIWNNKCHRNRPQLMIISIWLIDWSFSLWKSQENLKQDLF